MTMMSLGVPMILMGDEVRRTQQGNNNAYCQDNEIRLVRLVAAGQARRRASLRETASPRGDLLRDVEHERQRVSLNTMMLDGKQGLARRETVPAGLGRASHSVVLGAELGRRGCSSTSFSTPTGSRSSSSCRVGKGSILAALDRHGARFAATTSFRGRRHRRLRQQLSGLSPLGGDVDLDDPDRREFSSEANS